MSTGDLHRRDAEKTEGLYDQIGAERTDSGEPGRAEQCPCSFHPRAVWRRLVRFGFRLLYNELAWLYDPVSWIVSLGRWRSWQGTIRAYLPPGGRVLEVGCGPGHLLADLARRGYRVVGLDLSPAMLGLARRRLRRLNLHVPLCRARADILPFAGQAFDAVIATFPTAYVYDPAWIEGLSHILKAGGRLLVVETASLRRHNALTEPIEWLYRITGQGGGFMPDLPHLLSEAGWTAWRESAKVDGCTVKLVVAEWPGHTCPIPDGRRHSALSINAD